MTNEKNIRDYILKYVRIKYNQYLLDNKINSIPQDKIMDVVDSLYSDNKTKLIQFIKTNIVNSENSIITSMLNNIFSDDDICKSRLSLEIKQYQEFKLLNKNFYKNTFDILLKPDSNYGLGLNINIIENNVIIKGFKNPNDMILPAQGTNRININDQIIEVNYETLLGRDQKDIAFFLKGLKDPTVILKISRPLS